MTTVVWDGRYLAADSQTTNDCVIVSKLTKKIVEEEIEGRTLIIGFAGAVSDKDKLISCALGHQGFGGDLNANLITVDYKGEARIHGYDDKEYWFTICECADAIGSGLKYALTAIDLGKNAMEAVEVASNRCIYTGGTIRFYDTQEPEKGVQVYKD